MTTVVPKTIEVNNVISFAIKDKKVIISEIDDTKMSPFYIEIDINDWHQVISFINGENENKSI